jgi:NHLM bacteriocin system ABC transporter peptidase/ATP-binding protein
MQMAMQECGAAALAMILAYYKKREPLARLREDCGVSRDGASSVNIMRAAEKHGFEAEQRSVSAGALENARPPCILHWQQKHFVVLCGFSRKHAYINDPSLGRMRLEQDELGRSFSGTALFFTPGPGFKPSGKPPSVLAFVRSRLKGMFPPFIFLALSGLLSALFGIVNPVFTRVFIDRILSPADTGPLLPLIAAMTAAALAAFTVQVLNTLYLLKTEGKFAVTANADFVSHVFHLPVSFFQRRMAGDIAQRQNINQNIASALLHTLAPQLLNTGMLVFYLTVMIRYSPPLTAIGAGTALINIFLTAVITKKRIEIAQLQMRLSGDLIGTAMSGLRMIETLKSSGAEGRFFEKWAGCQAAMSNMEVRFIHTSRFLGSMPQLVQNLSGFAILGLGVTLIMNGSFSAGMLMAFQGFLSAFAAPMQSLLDAGRQIQEMRVNMERIDDVMHYPAERSSPPPNLPPSKKEDPGSTILLMRKVSFGYSKLSPPLIVDFDLRLETGKSAALVGKTGCGKSTVLNLAAELYKPDSGTVLFSEVLAKNSVSFVSQNICLFSDTIRNNLKFWDDSISDDAMIAAAEEARIHHLIMLRGGYDAMIQKNGMGFSGGERQRLALARALARNPSLLLLDEATSALDIKTEAEIMRAIAKRRAACIIAAHRLSTVRNCDEIIVLENGRIAERGIHEELLQKNNAYARLLAAG